MAAPSTASRTPLLGELAARIAAPIAARERCLPVDEVLASLLPEAGLVRGRAVGCSGPAAWSLAFALVAARGRRGAWVAVVGVPAVGIEAAGELGVPLGRVVVVDVDGGPAVWAERVAAAADGFEVIVTAPPAGAERVVRRVRQRLQSNGVVLVAVDADGAEHGVRPRPRHVPHRLAGHRPGDRAPRRPARAGARWAVGAPRARSSASCCCPAPTVVSTSSSPTVRPIPAVRSMPAR